MKSPRINLRAAQLLKQLNFTENSDAEFAYNQKGELFRLHDQMSNSKITGFEAPTPDAVHRWLRKNFNTLVEVTLYDIDTGLLAVNIISSWFHCPFIAAKFEDYDDAMQAGIEVCLEMLMNEKDD